MSETDQKLEYYIDLAGRDEVFTRARKYGWEGAAPKWIWNAISQEILAEREALSNNGRGE